jgi:CheY-like chemotaxis protein/predicted regulator of Ras-like GTPase activity (Roadblock/LC7/MglB family)
MPKVLVVDDSLSVRKVVERALLGRQMQVVCAATGSEALERIERDEPDVIVCDVLMPDKDGYEICEFVKRHPRLGRTPVLLMSGIVNDDVRERAARVQSADVLSKPFAADDLLRRLEALLTPPPAPPVVTEPALPAAVVPGAPPAGVLALSGNSHIEPGAARLDVPAIGRSTPSSSIPVLTPRPGAGATPSAPSLEPIPAVASSPIPGVPASHVATPTTDAPNVTAPNVVKPAPATAAGNTTVSSAGVLKQFAAIDGVQWAVLADREGFLLDASGNGEVDAEIAGALSACLTESSEGLGRELGRGPLHGMILEYAQGMVVLYSVGTSALLAIALAEASALGKVRYFAKKSIPELIQAV